MKTKKQSTVPVVRKKVQKKNPSDMVYIYRQETRKLPSDYPSPFTLVSMGH